MTIRSICSRDADARIWRSVWRGLWGSVIFSLLFGLSSTVHAQPAGAVHAILFYSPTCGHCHYVINEVLLPMHDQYGEQLQVVGIDVSQATGQQIYQNFLAAFNIPDERRGVPTLVIGETVLVGSGEIPEQFPGLVGTALGAGGIDWPAVPGIEALLTQSEAQDTAQTPTPADIAAATAPAASPVMTITTTISTAVAVAAANPDAPVYLAYFYDPTCLECRRVSAELDALEQSYSDLEIRRYNLAENVPLYEALADRTGVPAAERLVAPAIFAGDRYLAPDAITMDALSTLLADPAIRQAQAPWQAIEATTLTAATTGVLARFEQFGPLAVAGAGLLDGVNPCAFTTMIFFVSYLAMVGRKGREILAVGSAFTVGVFLTYMLLGLGLLEVVQRLGAFTVVGQFIYGVTALICLGLAALSLYDYIKIRRGQLTEIVLQLPGSLKRRIHSTIRTRSRVTGFVTAAFGAGILVSIFELACTGQVYLPTIVFVTGIAELRMQAAAYLLLYNLMFILPLVVIFVVTYWGTSSAQLTTFFQRHVGAVKLFTVALFGVLGTWLGYMVLQM